MNLFKQISTVALSLVLFFNQFGYRFLLTALEKTADQKLELSIDNNDYQDSQLVEISVPLNMPYQNRVTEFERAYGEVDVDGVLYSYVKMKVDGDKVRLKCIPNSGKQQLKKVTTDLAKSMAGQDMEHPGKKQQNQNKQFSSFYDDLVQNWQLNLLNQNDDKAKQLRTISLLHVYMPTPHQPPQC